ncbi:hypothetical protein PVAND_014201 [Polypedilum vanderplanki]|uniref:F-box domain-containing protein n=1 Tax=Polypedilum vanderplanki TaxID=319348 RepID=A0A9J6CTB7_POLVA|nr:hypothetical protein PVAND_014201 [Polypedilum vanderplanki]
MNICHLPDNILEKIFSEIDYYEVPNLTLVCKRFNDVIGSSSQLMKNLVIFWKKNITKKADLKLLLSSNRKYQIISIKEVVGIEQNLQNVYTKYANSLTEVQFFDCSFKSSELSATLKILQENLREIGMCKVNFEIDSIMKPIGFKKLEDMNMMYFSSNGFCKIFNLFIDCKSLKSLRCEDDCEISF